uniref:Gustatory receptor n=1 Tax=Panagrolaimus sp. PS1159 TaxID=55785 RepID=A0AC35GRK5_9BILA
MVFSIIALILFIIFLKIRKEDNFNVLPKSLRLFFVTSFIPASVVEVIGSILFSLHYLIVRNENDFYFKLIRLILGFASQHARGTLFILVLERIAATSYLETYGKYTSKLHVFFILTFFSFIFTLLYTTMCLCWIFFKSLLSLYFYVIYTATFSHFLTLIMAKVLHSKNQTMYDLLAYRVTLKTRYQVVENVKVLRYFAPTIVLFTVIPPIGVFSTLMYTFITNGVAPSSLFLLTYNPAYALILLYHIMIILKSKRIQPFSMQTNIAVISSLGKSLPTIQTTEGYFKDLRQQWG